MSDSRNRYRVSDQQIEKDIAWCENAWTPRMVGSRTMHVIERGTGVPLVLIPVFTGTEFIYLPQLRSLSNTFRVLLYKRRESVCAVISLEDRVEELRDLLDAHRIEQTHLCAHSDGAMVAIAFAAKYPERVLSLALFCVADIYRIPPQPFMQLYMQQLEKHPLEHLVPDSVLKRLLAYYGSSNSGFTLKQIAAQTAKIADFAKFFKYSMLPLLLDYDGRKLAPRVTCPVLLIHHASKDRILRMKQMESLASLFPDCRGLRIVQGGGHMFPYCASEEVNYYLEQFYDELADHALDTPHIVTIDEPAALHSVLVGRKASNLALLVKQRLKVPPAFVITADALSAEAKRWGAPLRSADADATDVSAAMRSATITKLIRDGALSTSFERELKAAYEQLLQNTGGSPVAVRSSSALEDLGEASFAGQYETILNVTSYTQLLKSVKQCLASYWSERAIGYRMNAKLEDGTIRMGIIVQTMLSPVSSGILFTRDPRIQAGEPRMVVNAVWGLGEAGVSGTVTPDEYGIDAKSGNLLYVSVGDKAFKLTGRQAGGVEEQALTAEEAKSRVLSDEQLSQLAAIGRRLEQYFDGPQDIEWGFDGVHFHVLQTRPITALYSPWTIDRRRHGYFIRWGAVLEWGKTPISPMTASILNEINFDKGLGPIGIHMRKDVIRLFDGYLYSQVAIKLTWRWLLTPFKLWKGYRTLHQSFDHEVDAYLKRIRPMIQLDASSCSTDELLHAIRSLSGVIGDAFAEIIVKYLGICMLSELLLARYYRWLSGDCEAGGHIPLLHGLSNKSLESDHLLWSLADELRRNEELMTLLERNEDAAAAMRASASGAQFMDRLHRALDEVGHRLQDLDITCSTSKDDPEGVLMLLRTMAVAGTANPADELASRSKERERRLELIRTAVRRRRFTGRWFESVYQLAARYNVIRENRPFYLGIGWQRLRELLLELGDRYVREGRLKRADDIFYIRLEELVSVQSTFSFLNIAQSRRSEWEGWRRSSAPDEINPPVWRRIAARRPKIIPADMSGAALTGTPGSPGTVTGHVRIVKGLADFPSVHPGDIIVAPSTTPAWTVLFGIAAAIVTDVGGALSHAAIVAREYRIPAVLGTGNATAVLKNGQLIRIDGSSGHITVLDKEPSP
ncbi:alpha/beta fold hydrolase [Paenibacillus xylaniclasticus]|uniref:alpha/beta fold hydrolase n=1 Tax=Paenibacillus xylaniclasticus TaxID=588083 RepID=UPI000FD77DD4|nr:MULTISPECIES: alpha/beta fold hydrolase [Paenibacillus]GFN32243.1 hypothetical protein PCURB6_25030 [Paenibacillus curdlanolyticus]